MASALKKSLVSLSQIRLNKQSAGGKVMSRAVDMVSTYLRLLEAKDGPPCPYQTLVLQSSPHEQD
jgi:hypothetical protein